MKKKKIILFIIVLLITITTYEVTNSYASYKSEFIGTSDSLEVAKWEMNVTKNVDLFEVSDNENLIATSEKNRIIAPGTKGTYSFTITGKPETNYQLDIQIKSQDEIGRLKYKFKINDVYIMDAPGITLDDIAEMISTSYANITYPKNHEPFCTEPLIFTIEWEWISNDVEDTKILKEVKNGTKSGRVGFDVTINAIQVTEDANICE